MSFLSLFTFLCVRVVSTLSSGYVRAPLPYRMVNAGLFDYKKKKKKKKMVNAGSCDYKIEKKKNNSYTHAWELVPALTSDLAYPALLFPEPSGPRRGYWVALAMPIFWGKVSALTSDAAYPVIWFLDLFGLGRGC